MIGKKTQLEVINLTKSYLDGNYHEGVAIFAELHHIVEGVELTAAEALNMRNLFTLFMLGQLVELETMRKICTSCGIVNSQHQVCYTALCTKLSQPQLFAFFEEAFERALAVKLGAMLKKHRSGFSRDLVTLVLDDSIFKRCFSYTKTENAEFDKYFGCFFSGQFGKSVWGFQVLAFGVVISKVFYPLYLRCVPKTVKAPVEKKSEKKEKANLFKVKKQEIIDLHAQISAQKLIASTDEQKDALKAEKIRLRNLKNAQKELKNIQKVKKTPGRISKKVSVAIELVKKWNVFIKKLFVNGRKAPRFYLSCDNGYANIDLSNAITNLDIIYISVPKMNQCISINGGKKQQIQAYIKGKYMQLENAHKLREANLEENQKTTFLYRLRALLCTEKRILTFLFFRLNGSRNVSVIYCTDPNIKAKTLRHHWFARTYIEQFFKLLKHYLRIQNAKSSSLHGFHCKLFRFTFIALHCQLLIQFIHKKCKAFKNNGLGTLRVILRSDNAINDLLFKAINIPFAV